MEFLRSFLFGTGLFLSVVFVGTGILSLQGNYEQIRSFTNIQDPEILNDPELLCKIYKYCGRSMVWTGGALGLLSLLYFIHGISDEIYIVVMAVALSLATLFLFFKSSSYARALVRDKQIELTKSKTDG